MALGRLPCCVVLVVAFCHPALPAHAQSLVDAARRARDTREQLGPPAKVCTNADLPEAGRVTEPTLAWAARYRSLLEAALRRERALMELLRERRVTQRPPAARSVRPDPAPPTARVTGGIPLSLAYSGYPVSVARRKSGPWDSTPVWHLHRPRGQGRRVRIQTAPRQTGSDRKRERSSRRRSNRRPAARSGYEESSRPFDYIAPGLPAPGLNRNGRGPGSRERPGRR